MRGADGSRCHRRIALTVRDDAVEDVLDVLLPLLPQGVHPTPVGDGRRARDLSATTSRARVELVAGER